MCSRSEDGDVYWRVRRVVPEGRGTGGRSMGKEEKGVLYRRCFHQGYSDQNIEGRTMRIKRV
jgi:hypothetical protein